MVRANYRKNKRHYQQYERERERCPERKEAKRQQQRKYRANNPEKYKARTAVGNALRDGRLEKGTCEVCGSMFTEAHHDDYSKPLIVRWLCRQHHPH